MGDIQTVVIYILLFISLYFEVFLLVTYLEKRTTLKLETERKNSFFPVVSIIVPCFNEEYTVVKTVRSLLSLDYPKEKLEIIIVNDGSTDGTAKVLKENFGTEKRVTTLHKENGGKYTALNYGLTYSHGEFVGCLDADSFVEPNTLSNIISYFEERTIMSVVPSIIVHSPSNVIQMFQQVEYQWGIFLRKVLSYLGALYVTPGPFSIFRKEVFNTIGIYTEAHKTEDLEFALRMQKYHYKIANAHNAYVHTIAPKTIKGLYAQRLRWTYGFLKNAFDYREMFFKREYGHLGLFVLPMAAGTIFTTLYTIGNVAFEMLQKAFEKLVEITTVGINISLKSFHIDWFFLNTDGILFLSAILSAITVLLILIGKKLAVGKMTPSRDLVYFFLLFPFLTPLWLGSAIYRIAFSKQISWR